MPNNPNMKHFSLVFLLLPFLTSGQVRMSELISKRGLFYEMAGKSPYSGQAFTLAANGDTQTIVSYKDGLLDGPIKSWYAKDHIQIEGSLEKGDKTGSWKLYYPSGKIKKQTTYSHNVENGEETFWFENGKMEKTGSYTEGKLNGKYTWYYDNGQKSQEGFLVDGVEDSTWNEWYDNGKQKMTGHFTDRVKNGDWTFWDEQGNVSSKKNYQHGLVITDKDNLDTYLEKMQYYIGKKNFKEALKNIDGAEATLTSKSDTSAMYMSLEVYRSKCYSYAFHYRQAEKILLETIGLTPAQIQIIQNSHLDKTPAKINQVIGEINQKDQTAFKTTNHIALALCYNMLGDSVNLQKEQQISMLKGGMKDYVINISLELYRLAGSRVDNYLALLDINAKIAKEGASEKLELQKVQYLIGNEKFEEAQKIVDRYLNKDPKNVTALLSKAALENAFGNVDKMRLYEDKAQAVDPNALNGGQE